MKVVGGVIFCFIFNMSFLVLSEDVGVGACSVERDNANFRVLLVEQQPVGRDVALPITDIIAMQEVVTVLDRERLVVLQFVNYLIESI